jgi:DnaJ-class molecular chaperone
MCPRCQGEGVWHERCSECGGTGLGKWTIDQTPIKVPPHSQVGQQVTVRGVGEPAHQREPGYLRVVLLEKP